MPRTHKGCGGEVRGRKCLKCGKVWGLASYFVASDIVEKSKGKFDPQEYRKRIRERRDIP